MLSPLLLAGALAGPLAPSGAPARPTGGPSQLDLVPADALFFARIADLSTLEQRTAESAWIRFLLDDEVQELIEDVEERADADLDDLVLGAAVNDTALVDARELLAALEGEVTLFAEVTGDGPDDVQAGLIVDLGEGREAFQRLLEAGLELLADQVELSGSTHRDVPLTTLRPKWSGDEGAVHMVELGTTVAFVGGADPEHATARAHALIEAWIAPDPERGAGAGRALAAARRQAGFEADVEAFVDLNALVALAERAGAFDELRRLDSIPDELFDELHSVGWAYASARVGEGESFDCQLAMNLPSNGLLGRIAALFGPVDRELLELVPKDATGLSAQNVDLAGLFDLLLSVIEMLDPRGHREARMGLTVLSEGLGIDVRGDLLGQLTGSALTFTMDVPASEALLDFGAMLGGGASREPGATTRGHAAVIGLRDAEKAEVVVEDLLALADVEPEEHEVHAGVPIQSYREGDWFTVYWAFTDDALVISLQPTPLRTVLSLAADPEAPSVLANEKLAAALKKLGDASVYGITDTRDNLKNGLEVARSLSTFLPFLGMLTGEPDLQRLPFGPKTPWPSDATVDRYFEGVGLSSFRWDADGLEWRFSTR